MVLACYQTRMMKLMTTSFEDSHEHDFDSQEEKSDQSMDEMPGNETVEQNNVDIASSQDKHQNDNVQATNFDVSTVKDIDSGCEKEQDDNVKETNLDLNTVPMNIDSGHVNEPYDNIQETNLDLNTVPQKKLSSAKNEQAIDLDDTDDGYDSDVMITGINMPPKPTPHLLGHVHRSWNYQCYLCNFTSAMQVTFTTHILDTHPDQKFQCDFCPSKFSSLNGLFKHECSHQYIKFRCQMYEYRCQFPYQLKMHHNTHIETDEFECGTYKKQFVSKDSLISHKTTHETKIKCPDCPEATSKTYTSINAFKLHKRGKHGPGWIASCGEHFQSKSNLTKHVNLECKPCKDQ